MKKIVLFAAAFIFSLTIMAQTDTKTTKATKSISTKPSKVQTRVETKPTTIAPLTAETQTVQAGQPSPDDVIKMNTLTHDFGKIPKGTPVTYSFEIKNISAKPLVLENVSTSCGCTTPEWDKKPILPGATSQVKVGYNAANPGPFNKSINITLAGIAQPKTVTIVGEVLAPAEPPKESKPNN